MSQDETMDMDSMAETPFTRIPAGDPESIAPRAGAVGLLVPGRPRAALLRYHHVVRFFVLAAGATRPLLDRRPLQNLSLANLDRWILARLVETFATFRRRPIPWCHAVERLVNDLSLRYLRHSRERMLRSDSEAEQRAAFATLYEVLVVMNRLLYPHAPELVRPLEEAIALPLSEERLPGRLEKVVTPRFRFVDAEILQVFGTVFGLVGLSRRLRARAGLGQAVPLREARVRAPAEAVRHLLASERFLLSALGVRRVSIREEDELRRPELILDTDRTEDLRDEHRAGTLSRRVQELRRRAGLTLDEPVEVRCEGGRSWIRSVDRFSDRIRTRLCCETLTSAVAGGEASVELIPPTGTPLRMPLPG